MSTIKPDLLEIQSRTLVGMALPMSVTQNHTARLWSTFIPRLKEIKGRCDDCYYSLQQYDTNYFNNFDPGRTFTKWAAVEITAGHELPEGMKHFDLPAGLYAVFHYKGLPGDPKIFEHIYGTWLPASGFGLDQRPHFELLGPKYINNSPESEEDIYIPIK